MCLHYCSWNCLGFFFFVRSRSPDSYRAVAYPHSSSSGAHLAPRARRRLATVLGGSSSSGVYVETHLSENFQLVLTHVTDLQVGIPSIPLDTTNGLWKIMMALINNTFPLNTYSILHWLCLSLCLQVLVCTIFKVRSNDKSKETRASVGYKSPTTDTAAALPTSTTVHSVWVSVHSIFEFQFGY